MKRVIAVNLLCLVFLSASALGIQKSRQSNPQGISGLVSQLSWDTVGGECNFLFRVFPTGEAADRLIEIGSPATDELLKALEDEKRGVAAHMILTAIWEPKRAGAQIRYVYEAGNPKPIYWVLTYNGLRWTWSEEKGDVVEKEDLLEIARRWRHKIKRD